LGRTTYLCDESSFLLTSVDVPLVSEIVAASERVPLLALFLKLDLAIVREFSTEKSSKRAMANLRSAPARWDKRGAICSRPVFGSWTCWMLLRRYLFSAI